MLFGKNRVLKLAVVNKIVRAQREYINSFLGYEIVLAHGYSTIGTLLTCDKWVSCAI